MDNFKYIVDILSSLASFVAIATVLISWFNSSKKALKIERIVVHFKKEEAIFILVIKNHKSYPVTIKSINAYLKPNFLVEKYRNLPPTYTSRMSSIDLVFMSSEKFEILADGHTDVRISTEAKSMEFSSLTFLINTSHGYHQLNCNQIQNIKMTGDAKIFSVEYAKDFDSKFKAWCKYQLLKLIYIFKKS